MTDPTNSSPSNGDQFNHEQTNAPQDAPASAPQADFAAPQADFSAPQADFAAPPADHSEPQTDYSAPQGGYSAPQADYSAPQADQQQYGAPAGSAPAGDPYGQQAQPGQQPQYGQPQNDQQPGQYGQPNYGAPAGGQYGQQQYGAPGQPQYGAPGFGQPQISPQEEVEQSKNAHMFSAIAAIFGFGWLVALIMYLTQKDKGPFIKQETGNAMNFQVSFAIYSVGIYIVSMLLMFIFIGFVTILAVFATYAMSIIFGFVNANRVGNGGVSSYPMSIKFVK